MAKCFIKIAVVYFFLGVLLGCYMGGTHRFDLMPVHAHANLLGWVSLGLVGVIYHVWPEISQTRWAKAHFWLHNLGLPPMMAGLWLIVTQAAPGMGEKLTGIGSLAILLGVLALMVNILKR